MPSAATILRPEAEFVESSDELVIALEVTGFCPEKLRIDLTDHTVTLRIPREPRSTPQHIDGYNAFATPC
jgi:HSP20 family molecular chaperone IbpA